MPFRIKDVLVRAAKTGLQSFAGVIVAGQAAGQEITASLFGAAVVAALAAVFSVFWNSTVKQV